MSTRGETTNKATVRRLNEELSSSDWELISKTIDELVEPDALVRAPTPPGVRGAQALKHVFGMLHRAFPDLRITVDDVIAEGDKVVIRVTGRGSHEGEFQGIPATGRQVTATGVGIARVQDGRIVESWAAYDALGLMQQLGAIPAN